MNRLSAKEYFLQFNDDERARQITQAATEIGVTRSILARHVSRGTGVSVATAKALAEWNGRISAAKTLGLPPEEPVIVEEPNETIEQCENCRRSGARGRTRRDKVGGVLEWCCDRMALLDIATSLSSTRGDR